MAVSVTLLTNSYDNVDRSTYTTASVSVTTGDYLLLFVNTMSAGTAATATVTGLSSTWTEAKTQQYSSVNRKLSLFRTTAAATTSGTLSIAAASSVGCAWALFKVTGVPTANPIVQAVSNSGTGTSGTITLAAASSSSNRVLSCFSHRANEATTPRTSWTELSDNSGASPSTGFETQWYSSAIEATASATWSTSSDWGGIAVELADSTTAVAPRTVSYGSTSGARAAVTLSVEVAFSGGALDSTPAWTEIGPYVRSVDIRRGKSNELDQVSAGTATLVLDNRDRRFDPLHASSPYYGSLKPRKQLRIRATYNSVTYTLFRGHVQGWPQEYDPPRDAVVTLTAIDPFDLLNGYELPPDDYAIAVLTDQPTAYYRCSGAAPAWTDYSGNGRHGAAGYPGFGDGLILSDDKAMAVSSDGLGDYWLTYDNVLFVVSAHAPDMGQSAWGDETSIEAWIKVDETRDNPLSTNFVIQVDGYIGMRVRDGLLYGYAVTSGGTFAVVASLGSGRHHIVAVSTTNSLAIYADGIELATTTDAGTAEFVGNLNGVANFRPEGAWTFTLVDEFAVYGTALTQTQIRTHYVAGSEASRLETTGARAKRLVDLVGWPTSSSVMGSSVFTGDSYCDEFRPSGTVLANLQQLVDTEQGRCFCAADGSIKFVGRGSLMTTAAYTTSQATFGDAAGELVYSDLRTTYDLVTLANQMIVTRTPGNQTTRGQDSASIGDPNYYGVRSRTVSTQSANDSESTNLINWRLPTYAYPQFRVTDLTISPQRDPANLFPQVLGRDLAERITVKRRPQGVGSAISQERTIEGIRHSFDAKTWTTSWSLGIPDPVATTDGYWVVGDSTYGKVETAKVSF